MTVNITIDSSAIIEDGVTPTTKAMFTSAFGSVETQIENILNAVQEAEGILLKARTTPTNPSAGFEKLFLDSADGHVKTVNSAGAVVDLEAAGSGMASFTLAGTSGTPQTITDGNTLTIEAGDGIATTAAATDKVTVAMNINGLTILSGAVDSANDKLSIWDASTSSHRYIAPSALPTGAGASYAIFGDERASGTDGGSTSTTTWNARTISTTGEYDPSSIVSIASNKFVPIAGNYILIMMASVVRVSGASLLAKSRLYNVTGAAAVAYGASIFGGANAQADTYWTPLYCAFTANGTDEYRFDTYTSTAQATTGLGVKMTLASINEKYLEALLIKVG